MKYRKLSKELLDALDPIDPDAIASRRDLKTINQIMGNFRWFEAALSSNSLTHERLIEIGAGDGQLAKRIIQKSLCTDYLAIDLVPQPAELPKHLRWHQSNIFDFTSYEQRNTLLANLVFHHFDETELRTLGESIGRSSIQWIIANEPRRKALHKVQLCAGRLIGFNHVTLHDGRVSIEAGFRQSELPAFLGLSADKWTWKIEETILGAYRMVASRL